MIQKAYKSGFPLIVGLLAFGLFLILSWLFADILWEWEQKMIDYRLRLRGPIPIHPAIVHIDIDDESLQALGSWPWRRSLHAQLIRALKEAGVKDLALDIIFRGEREEEDDTSLSSALKEAGSVYLPVGLELHPFSGFSLIGDEQKEKRTDLLQHSPFSQVEARGTPEPFYASRVLSSLPALVQAARGIGHITATPDPDGLFRRVPLVVSYQGKLFPSLVLAAVIGYLEVQPHNIEIEFGRAIRLKGAHLPDAAAQRDIIIPINRRGEMIINYAGLWDETFPHYSALEILRVKPEEKPTLKRDLNQKFCIISLTASGITDFGPTPLETSFPLNGIHSNILNTILTGQFLYELDLWQQTFILFLLMVVVAGLGYLLRPGIYPPLIFMLMVGYTFLSYLLFKEKGLLLNIINPWLSSSLVVLFVVTARYRMEEKEHGKLRSAFKLYLSPEILKEILRSPEALSLSGRRRELTILFSDIVGFSALSDKLEPEEAQALLNEYFEEMTGIVFRYKGTIDKFIGDGLMVLWGDPLPCEDHPLQAVKCAIEMQKRLKELKVSWQSEGRSNFNIRIGINTGWMTVGNMGSKQRMSYTVIGKQVNLAQRLQASAEPGAILISERTNALIKGEIAAQEIGKIAVKGFERPINAFRIIP